MRPHMLPCGVYCLLLGRPSAKLYHVFYEASHGRHGDKATQCEDWWFLRFVRRNSGLNTAIDVGKENAQLRNSTRIL